MENKFMGSNFQMANEKGEIVFEMKRKEPRGPDGKAEIYYIYQIHEEHMDADQSFGFHKVFKEQILVAARLMGIGMFAYVEIAERANEQFMKMAKAGNIPDGRQVDVTIEVYNHATDELVNLVVGISTKKVEKL